MTIADITRVEREERKLDDYLESDTFTPTNRRLGIGCWGAVDEYKDPTGQRWAIKRFNPNEIAQKQMLERGWTEEDVMRNEAIPLDAAQHHVVPRIIERDKKGRLYVGMPIYSEGDLEGRDILLTRGLKDSKDLKPILIVVRDIADALAYMHNRYIPFDFNERDFGLSYEFPILKNNDKFKARVGYEYWNYPTGTLGKDDQVLKAGLGYKGIVSLDLDVTHLLPHDDVENGTRYALKASKSFKLYENKDKEFSISLTPSVSTAITDNYYGKTMAFPHITPGINLGVSKKIGKATLGAGFFVNYQFALPEGKREGIESFTWGGFGINLSF